MSLFDASVDLNPHQIEAAMFALKSPLSKGVVLADEVGLGKTIEAGLVLCQYWAERRRRLLVVCPASLRKQWSLELEEKFNLPTVVLDAFTLKQLQQDGIEPFLADAILIVSLNFASTMQNEVSAVSWDLVVIDEAHKLRNAYRTSNKMGQRLRGALAERQKILLTATPLQNSLLELYGLCSVIDDRIFGEVSAFRSQYMNQDADLKELQARLQYFCKRTLRDQVVEYIQYTERRAITVPFRPVDEEHRLYDALSQFLLREDTYSIPSRQRVMTTLILRKLLASSSRAIAGTLETMRSRLINVREGLPPTEELAEQLILSEELEDEYLEESPAEEDDTPQSAVEPQASKEPSIDRKKLDDEIEELERYTFWARSVLRRCNPFKSFLVFSLSNDRTQSHVGSCHYSRKQDLKSQHETNLRFLRFEFRGPPGVPRCRRGYGRGIGAKQHWIGVRRRQCGSDGRARGRSAESGRRGSGRHPRTPDGTRGRAQGADQAPCCPLDARAQGAHGRSVGRVRRVAGRVRNSGGVLRGGNLDATRSACEALRRPECLGVLHSLAGDVRPCGGGAISEDGEPRASAGAGVGCRVVAGTGRVASGTGREMAGSGDAVNWRSTPKVGRNDPCTCGSGKKYKKCCGGATVN